MNTQSRDMVGIAIALQAAIIGYQRAKQDIRETNQYGNKAWKATAFRRANHARGRLLKLTRMAREALK